MTTKTPKKPSKQPVDTVVQRLRRLLNEEQRRLDEETEPTKRQTVVRTVLLIAAELRKATAAERKQFDGYNRAGVLSWARLQGQEERRTLARELAAMDAEGSILA